MPSHNHGEASLTGDLNGCGMNNTASPSGILQKNGDISGRRHISETQTGARLRINATHTHSNNGSAAAHNNLQPYIASNLGAYCINDK